MAYVLLVFVRDGLRGPPEPAPAGDALGDEHRPEQAGGDEEPSRQRTRDEQNVSEHQAAVPSEREVAEPPRGCRALVAQPVDEVVVAERESAYERECGRLRSLARQ